MARKVQIILTDDLTNEESEDISTVKFGIDGTHYEIDLTAKNAEDLRDELSRYVQAARKVKGATARATNRVTGHKPATTASTSSAANGVDSKVVREWAVKEGLLPEGRKGRIPGSIIEKYATSLPNA